MAMQRREIDMGHSKLPYRVTTDGACVLIVDADDIVICSSTHNQTASRNRRAMEIATFVVKACNAYDKLKDDNEVMLEVLKAVKLRIAFIDHPNEPKDWAPEIALLEGALALAKDNNPPGTDKES